MTKFTLPLVYTARCSQMCVGGVESECGTKVFEVVSMLMIIDAALCVVILVWAGYVAFELHRGMKKNFFFEYNRHHVNYLLNEVGVFCSIPLIILSNLVSIMDPIYTSKHIYWQYIYFLSRVLPCMFYLITKRNEDCLRCFNKDPSIRYSIYQWT